MENMNFESQSEVYKKAIINFTNIIEEKGQKLKIAKKKEKIEDIKVIEEAMLKSLKELEEQVDNIADRTHFQEHILKRWVYGSYPELFEKYEEFVKKESLKEAA